MKDGYRPPGRRLLTAGLVLVGILVLATVLSVVVGAVRYPPATVARMLWLALLQQPPTGDERGIYEIVVAIRLPRVMIGALVGVCLATAGTTLQGLLLNPLADPYIIGVSSGAALGATVAVSLGIDTWAGGLAVPACAFLAAMLCLALIYALGRRAGRLRLESFLVAGVAVGAFAWAGITAGLALAGEDTQRIVFWLMGSLSLRDQYLAPLAIVVAAAWPVLTLQSYRLNLLTLGEEPARQLGVPVERTRLILIVTAAMLTAAAVSVSGMIGFVGLMMPHIMRRIVGPDHRVLIPTVALAGAAFLVLADTAARLVPLASPIGELPVGVVTALIGAPFFIYLLRRGD